MISWIKIEVILPDKEEVIQMARLLKMKDTDTVVGKLIRLWAWADLQTVDGACVQCTDEFIDRMTFCKGFAKALRAAGWLLGEDGALVFPHFERHNGETTKERMSTNRRVARFRGKGNGDGVSARGARRGEGNGGSVTKAPPDDEFCHGANVTDVTEAALHFPLPNPLPEEELEGNEEGEKEIPRCIERCWREGAPPPPPVVPDGGQEEPPGFAAFAAWAGTVRPGWDAGALSGRERAAAKGAFLALKRPLSELERTACAEYLAHEPPNGSKFDYPPDRELFFRMFHEVLQKAVSWFRRTGQKSRSEKEATRQREVKRREEAARQAAEAAAMTDEERIEQIDGLRAAAGMPPLTEAEKENIKQGRPIHE